MEQGGAKNADIKIHVEDRCVLLLYVEEAVNASKYETRD
jgi:hypothetical protein